MKKVLFSLMTMMTVVGLVGGGAFAWFSDVETSTGNAFSAGTLDLAMGNSDAVNGGVIATASNMEPGKVLGFYDAYFKNVGSLNGELTVQFSYTEKDYFDVTGNPEYGEFKDIDVSDNAFAAKLVVTEAYLTIDGLGNGVNVAPFWANQITAAGEGALGVIDGLPTVYGLSKIILHVSDGYLGPDIAIAPNQVVHEWFKLKLDESADNPYEFDGVDVTITASFNQVDSPVVPNW